MDPAGGGGSGTGVETRLEKRQQAIAEYRNVQLPKNLVELDRWIALPARGLTKGKLPTPPTIVPDLEGNAKPNWCSTYNAMINPLIHIPIKGVLWYQGEANFEDEGELVRS